MAGEVIVDALPYIDQGYDEPGVREAALALVEEETRRYRTAKNYLDHLPPLNLTSFETDLMRSEWERMQQRQPMDILSMKRYELPPPPSGKMTDLAAWTECVENSMAQLEHQATRICNLELMLEYGCEAWKSYLEVLDAAVQLAQKKLHALRRDIQDVNWQRKSNQLNAGERLRELEATWVGLVSKNYDIEQACALLEEEIAVERQYREHGSRKRRIDEESSLSKRAKLKASRQDYEKEREEKSVQKEPVQEETVQEETLQEETVQEETLQEETVQEETVQEETVQEETVQEETVQEETVQEETAQEETAQEETVQEETVQGETVPEETVQEETVQEETAQEDIVQEVKLQEEKVEGSNDKSSKEPQNYYEVIED